MTQRKNVLLDSITHVTNTEQQNPVKNVELAGNRTRASRHHEQVWMILNLYLFLHLLRYPSSSSSSSSSSSFSSQESEAGGDDSEQEKTKLKNQPVNLKSDLSQELGEDRQTLPSPPQLAGVSETGQLQTNRKPTGNEEGEADRDPPLSLSWWEAAQLSLPSKVIQVRPAAAVSEARNQPLEPDEASTAPPEKASAM